MSESGRNERLFWSWLFPILTGLSILMFDRGHLKIGIAIASIIVAIAGCFILPRALAAARNRRWRRDHVYLGDLSGWYVECGGRRAAILSEPKYYDMFWLSYRVEPTTDDPIENARIASDKTWWLQSTLALRNIASVNVVCSTFPGGDVFTETGRVIVRSTFLFMPLEKTDET